MRNYGRGTGGKDVSVKARLENINEHPEKFDMSKSTPKVFAVDMLHFFLKIITVIVAVFFGIALFVTVSKIVGVIVGLALAVAALVSHEYKTPIVTWIRVLSSVLLAGTGILLLILL